MTPKKMIAMGCGGVLLLGILGAVGVGIFIYKVSSDLEGLVVRIDGPDEVVAGESFELTVVVKNTRVGEPLAVADIDIAHAYLDGFSIVAVDPPPKSTMDIPLDNSRSFTFGLDIPAGKEREFVFTLEAQETGMHRGDVDVVEGLQFLTTMAQTNVLQRAEE